MTDKSTAATVPEAANILVRIFSGIIGAGVSSYLLNKASLAGVDFKAMGIDSELVKSSIIGTVAGIVAAPRNMVYTLRDGILFIRFAVKTLWTAAVDGKE